MAYIAGQNISTPPSPASTSSRQGLVNNTYRPRDPYNDPYMDTYSPSNYQNHQRQSPPESKLSNPMKEFDDVLGEFSTDYSSAHGLPNIYKATTTLGRIAWTLLFFGALVVCAWQFYLLITKFMDFPVATEVSVTR